MRPVLLLALLFCAVGTAAQDVDISATRGMFAILTSMRDGAPRTEIEQKLDAILATRPYRVMFAHYNRSWRPNHLPPDVFKRMILSLRFEDAYRAGENERADRMRVLWAKYYADLPSYEKKLRQLESVDLQKLIGDGVRYAQSWLPADWKIPGFYFPVAPNGGSPAFTIDDSQSYDFLQLPETADGKIDLENLARTIGHESHHLGMDTPEPPSLTPAESIAFRVLTITLAEGTATRFVSGAPAGCAPLAAGVRTNTMSDDLTSAWNAHKAELSSILKHQTTLVDRALAGELTGEQLNAEMRDYWLAGKIGRAYVLGAEMFGAIHYAFGKDAVFTAMQDPRQLFALYNKALDAKPDLRCPRVPDEAVKQALSIGNRVLGEKAP